jgi:uncharacterized protein YfiM (DUF2279 family)
MSRATLLLLLVALLSPGGVAAQKKVPGEYGIDQTWTSRDKFYHFGVSAVGAGVGYTAARRLGMKRWPAIALSAGVMGAVGLVRELQDERRADKYFSEKDLLWDGAGITVGIWIPDRFLFRRKQKEPPA